jgi:hypothetical protein
MQVKIMIVQNLEYLSESWTLASPAGAPHQKGSLNSQAAVRRARLQDAGLKLL